MTARDFLRRARNIQTRIDQLEQAAASAWDRATSITTSPGKARVGGGVVSRKPEEYAELSDAVEEERKRLVLVKTEIIRVIAQVIDNDLAALLTSYYVNCNTWEQTAVNIHYSYYHTVHRLHPAALAAVESILRKML